MLGPFVYEYGIEKNELLGKYPLKLLNPYRNHVLPETREGRESDRFARKMRLCMFSGPLLRMSLLEKSVYLRKHPANEKLFHIDSADHRRVELEQIQEISDRLAALTARRTRPPRNLEGRGNRNFIEPKKAIALPGAPSQEKLPEEQSLSVQDKDRKPNREEARVAPENSKESEEKGSLTSSTNSE